MHTSRLQRSTNAPLRDAASLKQYCDKHEIPYSEEFLEKIVPDDTLKRHFIGTYSLTPLPPTDLKHHGTSTVAVFESKIAGNNHGDVVAAVAQQVGHSLNSAIETIHIHRSLNPSYRRNNEAEKKNAEEVSALVENQGIPVLHTSIGWDDNLLDFNAGHDDQANHLWRATAFIVDSAGNDGKFGIDGKLSAPFQKHNALTHLAPLVVHVGAAAMDENGKWNIEGYSSANSPTFLAPVASRTHVVWNEGKGAQTMIGTSASAPYASGALAALNHRYGAYLTREQILYAVMATCTPIEHVNAFEKKTPAALDIAYMKNTAGLSYNPEYGGFGLVHIKKADKLLSHMVALTQQNSETITVPTEERITLTDAIKTQVEKDGLYHYSIKMPAGFALKTSVEADFVGGHGKISITSPSGTTLPMVMSALDSKEHHFGMSTSHGWAGEKMDGDDWTITSTQPIKQLRLSQHHFLERDIIHQLDIPKLLETEIPDLSHALPLSKLTHENTKRILHTKTLPQSAEPRGLRVGQAGAAPVLDDVGSIITQLKTLPSGFSTRYRKTFLPALSLDVNMPAGRLESEAIELVKTITTCTIGRDEIRHQVIEKQLAAAEEYVKDGKTLEQITPLCNAGYNYLACENTHNNVGELNAEKAVPIYIKALRISKNARLYTKAYEINCNLYTALCRCCENGKTEQYGKMLEEVRKQSLIYSREVQGAIDKKTHRIEEGEYGFSDNEKIGTDNVSQCIAIIVQDPYTLKTGIAHVDNENDIRSLDNFFSHFGDDRLNIRLVGARFNEDYRTDENISAVMQYLSTKNADIISADIYGGNEGPSTVVVDPHTFTLEEKVPAKANLNEAASNAIMFFTKKGKPLIEQFDFTQDHLRKPIHLNTRMLAELRQNYFGKHEWEIEGYLGAQAVYDRPLLVSHAHGMEEAYNKEWAKLTEALETAIAEHGIADLPAQQARDALLKQSLFIGEHAEAANSPLLDWIKNQLFIDGVLQRTALEGPTAHINIYDPMGPPQEGGYIGHISQNNSGPQQRW